MGVKLTAVPALGVGGIALDGGAESDNGDRPADTAAPTGTDGGDTVRGTCGAAPLGTAAVVVVVVTGDCSDANDDDDELLACFSRSTSLMNNLRWGKKPRKINQNPRQPRLPARTQQQKDTDNADITTGAYRL